MKYNNQRDQPTQSTLPLMSKELSRANGAQETSEIQKSQALQVSQVPHTTLLQDIMQLLLKVCGICVVIAVIFTVLYGVFQYNDMTMEPAVRDGDLILFYRVDKEYVAGETVVVEYKGKKQVRRVVAVAGDVVDLTQDGLMINGAYQTEPRVTGETQRYEDGIDFPVTLKEGQIFVLADNREDAVDSRIYGPVNIRDALGKVMTILRRKDI